MTRRIGIVLVLLAGAAGCSLDTREPGVDGPAGLLGVPGSGVPGATGPDGESFADGGIHSAAVAAVPGAGDARGRSGVPTRLVFEGVPSTGLAGGALPIFTVTIEDEQGPLVEPNGELIALVMDTAPSDAGFVGFPVVETRNGIATFDAVGLDRPGTYQLSVRGLGLTARADVSITVTTPAFANVATAIPRQQIFSILASTREVLYASTDQGILRSDNIGASWAPASFGVRSGVSDLISTASEPDLIYAIMGSVPSPTFLTRSRNRGGTWRSLLAPPSEQGPLLDVALDDRSPHLVWACGALGIYKSEDRGERWEKTPFEGGCDAIVFGGPAPGALYAYHAEGSTRTLLKSETAGASWQTLRTLPNELNALFASSSGAVYLASAVSLERSEDGGATWSSAIVNVTHLVSSPADPARMYGVTGQRVRVSTDGGATFNEGAELRQGAINDLAVDPEDSMRVYAATTQGLFVSGDGGVSWAPPSTGLAAATDVAFHPTVPNRILAAGGVLFRSDDSGDSWAPVTNAPPSTSRILFDPSDANVAYSCGGDFFESRDGGETWNVLSATPGCNAIAIAGSTLWVAATDGVRRSVDGGVTWVPTTLDLGTFTLAADTGGAVLYAITNAGASKSTDAGDTWLPMFTSERAEALAFDPLRPSRVWLATCRSPSGGPLRLSVNSGDTWTTPTGFPSTELDGCASDVVFGASGALYAIGAQLYVSRDTGTTWSTSATSGVVSFSERKLALSPDETTVFVATDRGLFRSLGAGL